MTDLTRHDLGVTGSTVGTLTERMLVLPRAVIAVAVATGALFLDGVSTALVLVCAAVLLGTAVLAAVRLSRGDRGVFVWTSVADATACSAFLVITMPAPAAPGALLFPLLAFELGLKHGQRGSATAVLLLSLAIGLRASERSAATGQEPRVWLIGLLVFATGAFIWIAGTVRRLLLARVAAERNRAQLAGLLRQTVAAVLVEAGIPEHDQDHRSLLTLVDQAAEHPEVMREVNRRIAASVSPRNGGTADSVLSPRELEVLELLASGLEDREVADRLFVSRGTVRVHVSHIVHKLHVGDRSEAVDWFTQQRQRRDA